MRLKQIKLAGFKSFVDPTSVPFKSNLTAIVGPNGCGKSNIIDAVRWVMGESSAKHLRGESMSDVIFSGSDSRKPVGQASIELIFDNSDGTISGEYASYNELAIKRLVTREGQSQYFLNGSQCRKKDITSIFLGTGLGPRSYAIIEQGIISRLIEAKPDELRVYIEEAAGVSKYKERRKETERRIRHTRDNLERLSDIRDELARQLAHLQRQAKAAERYKEYKSTERHIKWQLIALRWQELSSSLEAYQVRIQQMEVELEALTAEQQSIETEIIKARQKAADLSDTFNEVQGRYYGVGAEIARLEQSIKHNQERRAQLEEDLSRLHQSERSALEHITQDDVILKQVKAEIAELEPQEEQHTKALEDANKALELVEAEMQDWQQDWDNFQSQSASVQQRVEVLQTQIQHSETLMSRGDSRLNQIQAELSGIDIDPGRTNLIEQKNLLAQTREKAKLVNEQAQASESEIKSLRQQRDTQQQTLQELQRQIQSEEGREVKLTALQQASLATDNEVLQDWLKQEGLSGTTFTEKLTVESGWEKAVETVFAGQLNALELSQSKVTQLMVDTLKTSQQSFYLDTANAPSKKGLASVIAADFNLPAWIENVRLAETVEEGIKAVDSLDAHESIVTRDGIWMGPGWLRLEGQNPQTEGVLEREQELRELTVSLKDRRLAYSEAESRLQSLREQIKQLESQWHDQQSAANHASREVAELNAEVESLESRLTHAQGRHEKLAIEIQEQEQQIQEEKTKLSEAREELEHAIEKMAGIVSERETLQTKRAAIRDNLEQCRTQSRQAKEVQHQLAMRLESLKTRLASTETGKQRAESQLSELGQRKEQLQLALAEEQTPTEDLEGQLQATLAQHQEVESELTEARNLMESAEQQIRQLEARRIQAEQKTQHCNGQLQNERMEWQAVKVRLANEEDQLIADNQRAEELLEQLDDGATKEQWQEKLEVMANKIQRLGAINLAAIDEYDSQSERKIYMDQQIDDLNEALDTLETAIRKIDKETTSRFRDTFETVNQGLQELFPKVFGGGHAYLEMTGDDLLSTGVSVMARPPGKRNSSISALSGGEKALTAIALVFAIFQMNPSPFCMLDEVDAPLDEANLGRFCRLVEEMSETVQFIYITHRKVTIEMAKHLSGVTMHEPGVSRMVSVDLDEATSLAEASQ